MHRTARWSSIALLALWAAIAAGETREIRPNPPNPPHTAGGEVTADVDLADVPVDRALHLLAETFDVSVAAGALPDARVTVRLRGIGAAEAFAAVAAAAGLEVVRDGAVLAVVPRRGDGAARQVVSDTLPEGGAAGLEGLDGTGVEVHRIGPSDVLLKGSRGAVEAAAAALGRARRQQVVDREFHLGTASGEETLKVVQPLLEAHVESATYNAAGHVLTVSALPATLARLEPLMASLTLEPLQYEIEVKVVEVSRNALRQIGSQGTFNLNVSGGVLATTFPMTGLGQALRYLPSANQLAALTGVGGTGAAAGSTGDSGFRFGQIDGRGIGLAIQLLEQSGDARVMATPKVTALDNRHAHISMVTTLRIPTYTLNQAFATTSVTGIEQVDVGTTLDVRPRHLDGHQILLSVTPEVSELEPTSSVYSQNGLTQGLPVVTRRRTDTEVILESGETLVIGGLVTEHRTQTHGKTPGLGDLPLIGRAFRLEGKQTDSTELLIFVTPRELPAAAERRTKVRVDDSWIPAILAARLSEARGRLHARAAADRAAGVRALEQMDAELRGEGIDVAPDVAALGGDGSGEVTAAAALFLLRERPVTALAELARFRDSRAVALGALAAPLAPHLRAALAEMMAREDGGAELLARRFDAALAAGDLAVAERLGEALAVATPALAAARRAVHPAGLALSEEEAAAPVSASSSVLASSSVSVSASGSGPASAPAGESPLAWSGTPPETALTGGAAASAQVRAALDLLASRTPDLRNLVGFALARIAAGAPAPGADAARHGARVATGDRTVEEVAVELVELAAQVFAARVGGAAAADGRGLARAATSARLLACERLGGEPCAAERREAPAGSLLAAAQPTAGPPAAPGGPR